MTVYTVMFQKKISQRSLKAARLAAFTQKTSSTNWSKIANVEIHFATLILGWSKLTHPVPIPDEEKLKKLNFYIHTFWGTTKKFENKNLTYFLSFCPGLGWEGLIFEYLYWSMLYQTQSVNIYLFTFNIFHSAKKTFFQMVSVISLLLFNWQN